jgi:hypothetical protein
MLLKKEERSMIDLRRLPRRACHCSAIFWRRTLLLFRLLKTFTVTEYPTFETKTGIAPPA